MAHRTRSPFTLAALMTCLLPPGAAAQHTDDPYDPDVALRVSQAAIGNKLGNHRLSDPEGEPVYLHDYAGKPLVISMIFTSCYHVCPTTTRHLHEATRAAREVLGNDSFEVVTIGFDSANDTPEAMGAFARAQGIDAGGWRFLSTTPETIAALSEELGFIFFPSPRGFDHLVQLSVIDRAGNLYAQVYGVTYELPWLVEPLKELVFNRPESQGRPWAGFVDRIRLFCTVYNPSTGRYEIDNSLFFQIAIGLMIVLAVSFYLWREFRRPRH